MKQTLAFILVGAISYLIGAIPFGLLIARARGIDIRQVGSGNIGATNVFRCVGKGWGLLTFALDAFKGFASAFWFPALALRISPDADPGVLRVLCAAAAIVGHNWPAYLRFRGGKGVATSAGALLGLAWLPVAIGLGVWILVFLTSRYVSVASITAAVAVAGATWALPRDDNSLVTPIALTVLATLIIWRHKSNIQRLANGTENRFQFGKKRNKTTEPAAPDKP